MPMVEGMSALCPQEEPSAAEFRRFARPRRTREAQMAKRFRAELTAHVGGAPSTVGRALIEQAAQLKLQLAVMDRRFAETNEMSAHDSRVYLAWSNSLTRTLRELGIKGVPPRPLSPAEVMQGRA